MLHGHVNLEKAVPDIDTENLNVLLRLSELLLVNQLQTGGDGVK